MRKGMVGLAMLVQQGLAEDPFSGALFAFAHAGVGVTAIAEGPVGALTRHTRDVAEMVAGIRFGAGSAQP